MPTIWETALKAEADRKTRTTQETLIRYAILTNSFALLKFVKLQILSDLKFIRDKTLFRWPINTRKAEDRLLGLAQKAEELIQRERITEILEDTDLLVYVLRAAQYLYPAPDDTSEHDGYGKAYFEQGKKDLLGE
jgi:hypothetical protein